MKITLTLSDAEVKGLKKYGKVVYDEKWGKKDIQLYMQVYTNCLHEGAVGDYVREFETDKTK